jgi:hypothetical protein
MPPALASGARCASHIEAAAVDLCQRCGSFICGECVNIRLEDAFCPACAALMDRPPSRRAKIAFALALAAPCFVLTGFAGLSLAMLCLPAAALALLLQEASLRRRGESVAKGPWFTPAVILVSIDIALSATLVGFLAWALAHGA